METIAGFFNAIARGLRGLFDLASMAVGVAPTSVALADAATVQTESVGPGRVTAEPNPSEMSRAEREYLGLWG